MTAATVKTIAVKIKNRWTGSIQFTAQVECAEDAHLRIKVGLAVKWAVLRGADLRGADLSGADLLIFQAGRYTAFVDSENTRIGCQKRTHKEWVEATDEQIATMASDALEWWTVNRDIIVMMQKQTTINCNKNLHN